VLVMLSLIAAVASVIAAIEGDGVGGGRKARCIALTLRKARHAMFTTSG
jgi:hypothetical protein